MNLKEHTGYDSLTEKDEKDRKETKKLSEIVEETFTAVSLAEANQPERARRFLNVTPQSRSYRQSFEDSFVASTFAEEGTHETAREFMVSKPPSAGRIYGDIVYWGTVAATVLTILGQMVTFMTKSTFLAPSYVLSSIWQQKSVEQIWNGAIGHLPQGHWYLQHLSTGPGITEMSLAFGVFIVIPAMVGSGYMLFRERNRLFGSLAMTAAVITTISMVGLLPLPVG